MKLVYILGLEHSGTTLTDHLLSSQPNVIGLGEVSSYFSPSHMRYYLKECGDLDDHDICSCGSQWSKCEFWSSLNHLNGGFSDLPLESKYIELVKHFSSLYGTDSVIVDSSKNLASLQQVLNMAQRANISKDDIAIVLCIKDVRSFAASMIKRSENKPSLLSVMRSFNYWLGQNRKFLKFLDTSDLCSCVSLYEALCSAPNVEMEKCLARIGLGSNKDISIHHNSSHIAMGNKGFTMRNREKIVYDSSWTKFWQIRVAFLFSWPARKLNQKIYSRVGEQSNL